MRPGKSFPSRNSKNAPPAVDKCVKANLSLLLLIAEIVSPPPSIDTRDSLAVLSEIFLAIASVPYKKFLFLGNTLVFTSLLYFFTAFSIIVFRLTYFFTNFG